MFGFGKSNKESVWEDFENEALPWMESLYRTARWMAGNETEAEDLVQETFAQALNSFHRYERGTNCRAWLMKIMDNLNHKRWRKLGQLKLVADTEEIIAETVEPFVVAVRARDRGGAAVDHHGFGRHLRTGDELFDHHATGG